MEAVLHVVLREEDFRAFCVRVGWVRKRLERIRVRDRVLKSWMPGAGRTISMCEGEGRPDGAQP